MYKLLCLLILPLQLLCLDLSQAEVGDFIVYAYKDSLVLVRVQKVDATSIALEEVSAPLSQQTANWQKWLSERAPGHTSWTISSIDTKSGKLTSLYSVDQAEYLNHNAAFQFLPTLLQLTLEPINPKDRKLLGPQPLAGERDDRPFWLPKIIFEGKQIHPKVAAYRVRWPDDDSELANKAIDLYMPEQAAICYLPYWIEVAGGFAKAKIWAVDSGKNLANKTADLYLPKKTDL